MKTKENRATEAVIASVLLSAVGIAYFIQYQKDVLRQEQADKRTLWVEGVDSFREEVLEQTKDRWTATDHWVDKARTLDRLAKDNPDLIIADELKKPPR